MSEPEIASELLRYTVDDPGQALGYHAGRRYLRELRGTQNIREFHDAVLASGPLLLRLLRKSLAAAPPPGHAPLRALRIHAHGAANLDADPSAPKSSRG